MRTQRVLLAVLGCVALAVMAMQGLTGVSQLALYAAPFLLLLGLLLSGRFIGEERILAAYRSLPRARRVAASWPRLQSLPLSSALERAPWSLRGPPAVLSA